MAVIVPAWLSMMAPKHFPTLAVLLTAFALLAFARVSGEWEEYTDDQLHVAFRYPKDWKTSPQYSDRTYFGGQDGEVQLSAADSDDPEQVCREAASHKLQPFGSHPQIKSIKVEGRNGCIVWPSDDQVAPRYAELVVPFPRAIEINGDRYRQLTLDADKKHFFAIIRTLKFVAH